MSDDGRTAVGLAQLPGSSDYGLARWLPDGSAEVLDLSADGFPNAHGSRVTRDGTLIAGQSDAGAYVWSPGEGASALPLPENESLSGMSADGRVIHSAGSLVVDGTAVDLPGEGYDLNLTSVSRDGVWVGGTSRLEPFRPAAFRWSEDSGLLPLSYLDAERVEVLSADGSRFVVWKRDQTGAIEAGCENRNRSLRSSWGDRDEIDLVYPRCSHSLEVLELSDDGTIAVGYTAAKQGLPGQTLDELSEAFLWHRNSGSVLLESLLSEKAGVDFGEWRPALATSSSADGLTIVGIAASREDADAMCPFVARLDCEWIGACERISCGLGFEFTFVLMPLMSRRRSKAAAS